jgi:hypothetical protein
MKRCLPSLVLWFLLALPALAQRPASAATEAPSFTADVDRRIVAAAPAEGEPPGCCDFWRLAQPLLPPGAREGEKPGSLRSKAWGWSAWSTDYRLLRAYQYDAALDRRHPGPFPRYKKPVRLPHAGGRLLFLAGGFDPVLLLEVAADRFRFIVLNEDADGGPGGAGVAYKYYPHPEGDLLVLTNADGSLGAGGTSGAVTTWLSVFDFGQDRWLLDTVVGSYEAAFEPTAHDDGTRDVRRTHQVLDEGRAVVLGPYRRRGNARTWPTLPRLELGQPPARFDLPAGTYRLQHGRYQRVTTTTSPGAAPR